MGEDRALRQMHEKIREMRKEAEELREMEGDFPAIQRNLSRILASIKMLELNVSDVLSLG